MNKPEIATYRDYRILLKDLYYYKKEINPNFSYQYCAKKLNTTASYLKHIINERRHSSLDKIYQIADLFQLSAIEKNYLTVLFIYCTINDEGLKEYFHHVLTGLRGEIFTPTQKSLPEIFDYKNNKIFNNTLKTIISSMSKLDGFQTDANWIKEQLRDPSIPLEEIQFHLNDLINNNLIGKNNEFVNKNVDPYQLTRSEVYRDSLFSMYQALEHERLYYSGNFTNLIICIPVKHETKIFQAINECKEKLIETSKEYEVGDSVYMVNLGAITVASTDARLIKEKYLSTIRKVEEPS